MDGRHQLEVLVCAKYVQLVRRLIVCEEQWARSEGAGREGLERWMDAKHC